MNWLAVWYVCGMPDLNPDSKKLHGETAIPVVQEFRSDGAAGRDTGHDAEGQEVVTAELAGASGSAQHANAFSRASRPRRKWVPLTLFGLTCVSTFFVGACQWVPVYYVERALLQGSLMPFRQVILRHWQDGLVYMACVLAILFAHEMGHFVATLFHRVRASLPYFLPIPFTPVGTLGAVILMDGRRADRRQMFDIGIAGPLAGLVLAIPIMWYGVATLDLSTAEQGGMILDSPLVVEFMLQQSQPEGYQAGGHVWISQVNAYFMAGWVGLLITGLNMLPVSQLDGGHVIYTLFGKWSHWIARAFMVTVIALVVYDIRVWGIWLVMVFLVLLMGADHPPTRDDTVKLGWQRVALGFTSLAIPLLCFPPRALILVN